MLQNGGFSPTLNIGKKMAGGGGQKMGTFSVQRSDELDCQGGKTLL
jgi:hypothetical protein